VAADLLTGDAVLAGLVDGLTAGVPPRRFPVADPGTPLAGIEVAPGLVTLFGGAPGAGKTALVLQLAFDALRLTPGLRMAVCNVEMRPTALLERQLARVSGIPLAALRDRRVKPDDPRLVLGLAALRPLAARTAFVRPPYTTANLAEVADAHGAELVAVDYVQRVGPGGEHASKKGQVDAVMDQARRIADAGVAVVLVAAVGRTRDQHGRAGYGGLTLASFRESSELEYGADDAFLLTRQGDDGAAVLHHAKSRHGEPKDLHLRFNGAEQRFEPREEPKPKRPAARRPKPVPPGGDQF
jgi:replicative DNA helicase